MYKWCIKLNFSVTVLTFGIKAKDFGNLGRLYGALLAGTAHAQWVWPLCGKEIEGTSDSAARMKCLSVSDFQVSERLANKVNPSLLHRGLLSLLFVRAGKWGEVKSKHAEPGKKQNEAGEGFPSSSALPLFFIFPVFAFPGDFRLFPLHWRSLCGGERGQLHSQGLLCSQDGDSAGHVFFSILTKFKRVKKFYFAVKYPP